MNLDVDIAGYLGSRGGLQTYVEDRIYAVDAPPNAQMPYITWIRTTTEREHHMMGASGVARSEYDLDVFDTNRERLLSIVELIRLALDGYVQTDKKMGSVIVRRIEVQDSAESILPPSDGGRSPIYTYSIDFSIWYREAVPVFPAM